MAYQEEFIARIAPIMQKYAVQYGHKVVSAAIGQACLESGYGTTFKATAHKNYFGLKYRANRLTCNNGYFKDGSTEQLKDGTSYNITDLWYHFDTDDAACCGYYQFVNIANYANLKTSTTPLQYLTNIKNDGYATDVSYVQKVSNIIAKYNLTQYDTLKLDPEPKPISEINIIKQCATANTTVSQNRKIQWIVLHYTAGVNSKVGTARGVASYFNNTAVKASADFIVDEGEAVQYNPDLTNRYTWAVGGSKYSSMSTPEGGKYYGQCTNANSISIEMCSKKLSTATKNATDVDWYFESAVVDNAAQLTRYLMDKYNIDINHVIMHHHVTGKICPNPWCVNSSRLTSWESFKKKLAGGTVIPATPVAQTPAVAAAAPSTDSFQVQVLVNDLVIRQSPNGQDTGKRTGKGTFTIVESVNGWGKLKSGAGYIYLKNTNYVKILSSNTPVVAAPVATTPAQLSGTFQVKVKTALNIRDKANGNKTGKTCPVGVYTIVAQEGNWGLLKSYEKGKNGWINISPTYVDRI